MTLTIAALTLAALTTPPVGPLPPDCWWITKETPHVVPAKRPVARPRPKPARAAADRPHRTARVARKPAPKPKPPAVVRSYELACAPEKPPRITALAPPPVIQPMAPMERERLLARLEFDHYAVPPPSARVPWWRDEPRRIPEPGTLLLALTGVLFAWRTKR